ncbi:unnamed protein product [Prorocentrum cordatum]|uniref:Uncharacterized protein n=1 Tax=Prorocentrum cordatum TaxID=2364126 RepID=A0ABN9WDH4_9DINO|nr:unnamed protein product [Polarella glacialis]
MAPSATSVSRGSSTASSDERQPWHGYTVEWKATSPHVMDEVEMLAAASTCTFRVCPSPCGRPSLLQPVCPGVAAAGETRRQCQTQRKKHQRRVKKVLRRALADEPREGVVRL